MSSARCRLTEQAQVVVENRRKKRSKTKQSNWLSEFLLVVYAFNSALFVKIRTIVSFWVFAIFVIFSCTSTLASSQFAATKIASHRPSSLPQLTEFGLAVNERARNNIHARWSELTLNEFYCDQGAKWSDSFPTQSIWIHSSYFTRSNFYAYVR